MKCKFLSFAVVALSLLASCTKEDRIPENPREALTSEELAEMAAVDKFAAANSVIRALALINELPDDWESRTFEPEEGVAVDEANADIRNVVVTGVEHARNYFHSLIPDEGLDGDTWAHEGVGTLTFRVVDENNCYAIIDVNLVHMPGLTQLRLVPEEVVGENSYSGPGYYQAGDVVRDKKGVIWICVRPSGGPGNKSRAYFVSFDKTRIKTKTVTQKICAVDDNYNLTKTKMPSLSGKWTYATNLVDERIAIATAHTFAMLNGGAEMYDKYGIEAAKGFKEKAKFLKDNKILDVSDFLKQVIIDGEAYDIMNSYAVAYGSYKSNSNMDISQEKYLQPLLTLAHTGLSQDGKMREEVAKTWIHPNTGDNSPYYFSLTTDYDPLSFKYLSGMFEWADNENDKAGHNMLFDINNYMTSYTPGKYTYPSKNLFMNRAQNLYVMVLTQTYVKDHGKPYSGFELLTSSYERTVPDYWGSLDVMYRTMFDKKHNRDLVENLID